MGKFVVIQRHVSNDFFSQFSNTLYFDTQEEVRLSTSAPLKRLEPKPSIDAP